MYQEPDTRNLEQQLCVRKGSEDALVTGVPIGERFHTPEEMRVHDQKADCRGWAASPDVPTKSGGESRRSTVVSL